MERFYRALLFCYPAEFRCEYAAEMTQAFRDRYQEEHTPLLWFDLIADIAITASKEHCHMLLHDLSYAARTLRKAPAFTAAAILTLALGIGANTAIFSVVNAVMLRPLPFAAPDRLMRIGEKNDKLRIPFFGASVLNYLSWKEHSRSFEQLGAFGFATFNLTGRGDPEQFTGTPVSPSLFPLLGIQPKVGRAFAEGEDRPGSAGVAMLSEALWKRRFGGDRSTIGRTVTLNGVAHTIVGIAPPSLALMTGGDIWVPLLIDPAREFRLNHVIITVGRLKPGVSQRQAQAETDTVAARVGMQYPEVKDWGISLLTFHNWFVPNQLAVALLVLLAAVTFVLLIACANVANLLLSRAASREREIAVRTAMGASRGRLLRQLLTESLLLSVVGGGCGVLAAAWGVRAMSAGLPPNTLPITDIGVDGTVLLFAIAVTLGTGVLFGLAPAWQTAKTDINTILKQGGRSGMSGARPVLRNLLVAGELALATVLLIGAGLLIQSLYRLQQVNLGFRSDHLMTFQLATPVSKYPPPAKAWALYRSLLESLSAIPGVRAAAVSSGIPFGNGNYTTTPTAPVGNSVLPAGASIPIEWRTVSADYFRTLEIPLFSGRTFGDQDVPGAPAVAIVSRQTAKSLWDTDEPIGRQIRVVGSGEVFTVVGIVGDIHTTALNRDPVPAMYFPAAMRLRGRPLMDVVVRTAGRPESVLSAIRQKVRELDPELPVSGVRTMDEGISGNAATPRLNSLLLGIFACVALAIAGIGIYGVLAYSVNQRTREIGVRLALGAQSGDVRGMIVREGMRLGLAGIAVGLAGAVAVSRAMSTLLFGIEARDPATFAGVAVVLVGIALAACYIPARRATRVDPVVALRYE